MKSTFRRLQCGILAVAWLLAGCNSDVLLTDSCRQNRPCLYPKQKTT